MNILPNDVASVERKISRLKAGSRLYASVLKRNTKLSNEQVYEIINFLISKEVLQEQFQLKYEGEFFTEVYSKLSDIPVIFYDEESGRDFEVNFNNNVFVFFEVKKCRQ